MPWIEEETPVQETEAAQPETEAPTPQEFYPARPALPDMPERLPAGTKFHIKGQEPGSFEHAAWKEHEREQMGWGMGTRTLPNHFHYTDGWSRVHYSHICWDRVPRVNVG